MVGVVGVSGQINRGQKGMWCRTQDWKINTRNPPNPLRNPTNPTGCICSRFQRCSSEQDENMLQDHDKLERKLSCGPNIARMSCSFFAHNLFIHFLQPDRPLPNTGILSVTIGFCMDSVLWYGVIHISAHTC